MPGQPGIQPGLGDVRRVDREPLPQGHPGRLGAAGQLVDLRPRALGVDVVGRERRDPAPVVDPGGQDELVGVPDQVGRGLDPRRRAEQQPGHRDRRGQVVELGIGHGAHLRVRFGPEVLNDNFLDAAVLLRDPPDGEDRVRPLGQRLADADQDAGGERDRRPARVLQHPQPHRRVLVRAAVVRPAPVGEQPGRGGLQHHPHRRRHRLEPGEVLPGEHARVQVRQQAGLLQHPDGHRPDVGQRVVVAAGVQPLPRLPPAVLGPVAEGEQSLLAAEGSAPAGDVQHLVRGQVGALQPAGHGDECAVAAPVPAEPGEGDEHLARIGDDAGAPGGRESRVADPAGVRQQRGQLFAAGMHQHGRLARVQRLAVPGAGQRAAECAGGRRGPLRRAGGGQIAHTGTLIPGFRGTPYGLPHCRGPEPRPRRPVTARAPTVVRFGIIRFRDRWSPLAGCRAGTAPRHPRDPAGSVRPAGRAGPARIGDQRSRLAGRAPSADGRCAGHRHRDQANHSHQRPGQAGPPRLCHAGGGSGRPAVLPYLADPGRSAGRHDHIGGRV